MAESRSRLLSVVPVPGPGGEQQHEPGLVAVEPGPADVVTMQRGKAADLSDGDEEDFFLDIIAE